MCGRYAYILPPEMMVELFRVLNEIVYPPRYNIAPTQPIIAIWESGGRREAHLARWGLMPGWVKDPKKFPLIINSRIEGIPEKPAFRSAIKHTRCIVPADGYYEWKIGEDGSKTPYFIAQASGETMAFAGLYSIWEGPEGEVIDTACIVTVEPNREVSEVYDRMPAILAPEAIDTWLDTAHVGVIEAADLCRPAPEGSMIYHVVGKAVGSSNAEGPQLILPVSAEDGPAEPHTPPRKRKAAGGGQGELF